MNKNGLIIRAAELSDGLTQKQIRDCFHPVFEAMKETLANGDDLFLEGLGSFLVREKKAYLGHNPSTGQPIKIKAKKIIKFKQSKQLQIK